MEETGFNVVDAVTGKLVDAIDAIQWAACWATFALSEEGQLLVIYSDSWYEHETEYIPREGRYMIRFVNGREVSW